MSSCKTCQWWQDYTNRVMAVISTGHSTIVRNRIELRKCKFVLHPAISDENIIYTDSDYVCGSYSPTSVTTV